MFKTIRRYYWLIQMFVQRHLRVIGQSTLAVLLIIGIFFLFARYIPTPKSTVKIGRVGKHELSTLPSDIQKKLSLGLVTLLNDGTPAPGMAKSWEVSSDGLIYHFTLDDTLRWHDGSRLTPEDITYNFKEVQSFVIDGGLKFVLQEPFSPFFYAVSRPVLKNSRLGIGEYRLTKSKLYSGTVQTITLESEIERLIYKFYPTEASVVTAYKLGEINRIEGLSYLPTELSGDSASLVEPDQTSPKIAAVFINNNDTLLASKSTRQGLAYALRDKSFGHTRALSPVSKHSWAYNALVKDYNFDLEKAKSLFTQDVQDPSSVKLELKTVLQYLEIAEKIAEEWRQNLGIAVDVKVVSGLTTDYQLILADYTPPVDPDQYTIWHSTQPTNFTHFSNLKVDKLLEDGRRTLDQKLRKDIYQDFQRFLLEDSPAIFLFDTSAYTVSRKSLI